jgi:hypothetical protein
VIDVIVLGTVLVLAFGAFGAAKVLALAPMRESAAHFGGSVGLFRLLGAAELAGAAGVVVSIWYQPIGVAAGIGLLIVSVGGAVAHLRAGDGFKKAVPAIVCAGVALAFTVMGLA